RFDDLALAAGAGFRRGLACGQADGDDEAADERAARKYWIRGHAVPPQKRGVTSSNCRNQARPDLISAARRMAARIRWSVPQRQMLPAMAASMSASEGLGLASSSAEADMIWPDWQ